VPTAAPARRSRRRASTAGVTAGAYSRWWPPRRPPEPSRPGGASRRDHRRPPRAGHARASRVSRLAEAGSAGSAKACSPFVPRGPSATPSHERRKPRITRALVVSGRQDLNLRPPGPQPERSSSVRRRTVL
jgi:hypothetical protein